MPEALPPRLGGKYQPIRLVATGGMGSVYEVEHVHTGERLALKVLKGDVVALDPSALDRFRREARVAARVKSDHIVRVIDADVAPELGNAPFLVMDLLDGQNLAEVAGDEPQPPERVVEWLAQVARALDKAHELGIVHRDLKPENLFLERKPDGSTIVKILDFGVAKVRSDEHVGQTASGALLGTPLYMAREQVEGANQSVGPGTDMWSLAVIAFRLLAGQDYWTSKSVPMLLVEILHGEMAPPSSRTTRLGQAFDLWFQRSCNRDPNQRWPTVAAQIEALADALGVPLVSPRSLVNAGIAATLPIATSRSHALPVAPAAQSVSASTANVATTVPGNRSRTVGILGVLAVGIAATAAFVVGRSTPSASSMAQPSVAAPTPAAPPTVARASGEALLPAGSAVPSATPPPSVAPAVSPSIATPEASSIPRPKIAVPRTTTVARKTSKPDPLADPN